MLNYKRKKVNFFIIIFNHFIFTIFFFCVMILFGFVSYIFIHHKASALFNYLQNQSKQIKAILLKCTFSQSQWNWTVVSIDETETIRRHWNPTDTHFSVLSILSCLEVSQSHVNLSRDLMHEKLETSNWEQILLPHPSSNQINYFRRVQTPCSVVKLSEEGHGTYANKHQSIRN